MIIKRKEFIDIKQTYSSDFCDEFEGVLKGKILTIKKYKNQESFDEALYRYKKIYSYGIYTPVLKLKDKKQLILVFEKISGDNVAYLLSKGDIEDKIFEKLFTFYRYARANQIELNYLPENFVFDGKRLYYVSLDLFPQNKDLNLENYGLEFWIMSKKGYEHLLKLGYEIDKKRMLNSGETNKKIVLLSLYNW